MISSTAAMGLTALFIGSVLFRSFTRPSLSIIRGPTSPSFIFGNLLELFQRPVGEADFRWQNLYGNVVRFKGAFGVDQILITDPKALQKMFNTSADGYSKMSNLRAILRMLVGKGVVSSDGGDHRRQRSIMLPAFGLKESRALLPIFKECADTISMKWLETIGSSNGQTVVFDVRDWISRGTLDAIGQAAFDVRFDSIQDDSHPLSKTYHNLLGDVFGVAPPMQLLVQAAAKHIPMCIFQWVIDNSLYSRFARARHGRYAARDVARELVREKADALLQGRDSRDVFTLLVKANMDADAKNKLTESELLAQMCTLLLAAHETSANTIAWILLELAQRPMVQSRLREEIRKKETSIQARGGLQPIAADLDSMAYLNAVIKEGLRLHPTIPHMQRKACQDVVLPLSKPILSASGDMLNEILVPKGTHFVISIAAYNRDKDLWGEDAHEFNPDRWLYGTTHDKQSTGIGVYSNLFTFSSGPRACLGWRFALVEIQAFVSEMVGKFEFTMTDKAKRVLRHSAMVMTPMVDGEPDHGIQLPLAISLAPQDD